MSDDRFPNSGDMAKAQPVPVDPAVRDAFPNSPELFAAAPSPAAPSPAAQQRARLIETLRAEHGANLDQTLADARGVVAKFGDADLKAALNESGLGSHPAMVRLMAKLAAAVKGR